MNLYVLEDRIFMNFLNEPFPDRTTVGSDLCDVVKIEIDIIAKI